MDSFREEFLERSKSKSLTGLFKKSASLLKQQFALTDLVTKHFQITKTDSLNISTDHETQAELKQQELNQMVMECFI